MVTEVKVEILYFVDSKLRHLKMACGLRCEEGLTSYQGTGKVVTLAVCGMERKVKSSSGFCTCISCVGWEYAIFLWLEYVGVMVTAVTV